MAKVEDAVKSGSLFGGTRLMVLKNVFFDKTCLERTGELIKTQNLLKEKDVVLLFIENQTEKELSKNKTFFKLLTEKGSVSRNFEFLEGLNLKKWIKKEFALRDCDLDEDALRELILVRGNESGSLINEIEKLCNFSLGKNKNKGFIRKNDVSALVFKKNEPNVFHFIDAIATRNRVKSFEFLFGEIESGREPYYLLTMIIYGFRGLLAVKDLSERGMSLDLIIRKTKLHPFVARKTYQSALKFKMLELKNAYNRLSDMDIYSKEGKVNLEDSLFDFVLNPTSFEGK